MTIPRTLVRWSAAVATPLLALACLAAPAAAVTVTLQPSTADTYLDQNTATTNYGGNTTMQVRSQNGSGGSGRNARAIVRFDLSQIPAGATINSATLRLYMTTAPTQNRTYGAHRITADWTEGGATWSSSGLGNWNGGSFNNTATGTTTTGTTSNVWRSWDVTADVQAWVNGSAPNHGWLVKDASENSNTVRTANFATSENGTSANHPTLVIDYEPAYTITLSAGSAVVMSEPSLLNFTIANIDQSPATERLGRIYLTLPYTVSGAVAPPGWKVTDISGNSVLFDTEDAYDPGCSAAALGNGQSAVFGVYVTATAAGSEVTTDTVSAATVGNDCNTPGAFQYYFTRSGAFPTWARRGLGATLVATPVNTAVGGTITLTMTVTNRTTGNQNSVTPVTDLTLSGTGTATKLSGPTPASASLAPGASQNFTYTYQATGVGSVTFSGTAANNFVQSLTASDTVQIGPLTASLDVSPTQQTSGGQVTVTMSVTNNSAGALTGVTPSALTPSGTATVALVSGPTPASVASLGAGATTSFSWTYTVSGATGATFAFSGSASAADGSTSNTATSSAGSISSISVAVSPTSIPTGAAATLTYTVDNQTGEGLQRVVITAPTTGFVYSTASGPAGWSISAGGTPTSVTFQSPGSASDLASGATGSFVVTWSAVPSSPNTYAFTMDMTSRSGLAYSRSVSVSVTQYAMTLTASPATLAGDGASTSTITVTLTSGGSPLSGASITLTKTMGTLAQETLTTNASGQATTTYTSAMTTSNQTATVTATYGAGTSKSVDIALEGVQLSVSASPAAIGADGQSTSTATITLTKAGAPWSGRTVTLATSAGTLGATSFTTSGSGQASTTLTSTASESDVVATLTAGYLSPTFTATTTVTFQRVVLTVSASPAGIAADGQSTSTITVTVTQNGAALSGASVTLGTTAGTLGSTSLTTNASGQATTLTATASESDVTATVTATYRGHQKTTTVTFERVVLGISASPATIPADGSSASTITLTLTRNGAALPGATIGVSTTAGSLSGGSATTDAAGQATVTLTSSSSGSDVTATVTATYRGHQKTTTVTFAAVAISLSVSPASVPADGATTATLTATVTAGGSPLAGRTVSFSATSGTLSSASAVTSGAGVATVTIRSTTASKSGSTPGLTASHGGQSAVGSVTFTGITIAEVPELRVVSGSGTNTAYWSLPGSGYIDGVLVLRRAGGTPQAPADGVILNPGDTLADGSRVVARVGVGSGTSATDGGLTPGATYHYRAFGYFTSGALYSTAGVSLDAPGTGAGPGQPRWVVSSSTAGWVEPTMDGNGGVLWGSPAGGLVDSSWDAGAQAWSPVLGGRRIGGAVSLSEIEGQGGWYALFGTDAGTAAAVDVPTGTVLWETPALGDAIASAVGMQARAWSDAAFQAAYTGDVVFVGTSNASATDNKVYALDAATGAVLWTFNAGGGTAVDKVTGWLWVDHGTNRLFVTTRSNGGTQPSLWVLSTLDGTLQASWSLGDITSWLGMSMDGGIYVATASGKLYELDPAGPAMKWSAPFDTGAGNRIVSYVWEDWGWPGRLFFSTQDGHVWALDATGSATPPVLAWKTAVPGASAPLVLTQGGVLWVGGSDGKIHQLRLTDGVDEKQATVGAGTAAVGTPTWDSASGWLYVGTSAGKLFAIPTPLP